MMRSSWRSAEIGRLMADCNAFGVERFQAPAGAVEAEHSDPPSRGGS